MTIDRSRSAPSPVEELRAPTIHVDHHGLIRIQPRQFHTREELLRHFVAFKDTIGEVRARVGRVRVLVDLRGSTVLAPEGANEVQKQISTLYQPQDRLALILVSQLVRMQSRRIFGSATVRHFDSLAAAEDWLLDRSETTT